MVHHSSSLLMAAFQCAQSLPATVRCTSGNIPEVGMPLVAAGVPTMTKTSSFSNIFGRPTTRVAHRRRRRHDFWLHANAGKNEDGDEGEEIEPVDPPKKPTGDREFLKEELARVESLEEILEELEALGSSPGGDDDDHDHDFFLDEWDEETLEELFMSLPDEDEKEQDEDDEEEETYLHLSRQRRQSTSLLENALLQGVVAPSAGVGSNCLPGDFNFDPLDLASKDYFPQAQAFVRNLVPAREGEESNEEQSAGPRPKALILRDYREAEIRHGRLAMLAAIFWPLQELLDRLVLDEDKCNSLLNSLLFGGVTLPYFPLLMTAIMLLLGYLDIYSQAIKDVDKIGDAFLPGDCFWDPLQILTGAPDRMKRNMQERELFNGRFAMLAIAVFVYEEARTGKPIVSIPGNEILFQPAYQVPFIQKWLDSRFSTPSPVFYQFSEEELARSAEELARSAEELARSTEEFASTVSSVDFLLSKISESITISF